MLTTRTHAKHLREEYFGRLIDMPSIDMFGWSAISSAGRSGLAAHTHPKAYEICLIVTGHVTWWADSKVYRLGPGSVYITRPGERHGGMDDMLQPCEIYWLQVHLGATHALPGLARSEASVLADRFASLAHRTFAASSPLCDAFVTFHHELRHRPPCWRIAAQAALHTLLISVIRDHDAAAHHAGIGQPSPPIRRAMARIEQHITDNIRVTDLARQVGLGVSRFHERFAKEVGFSPADYRLHLRIRHARTALGQTDHSITVIAHDLGFSSSQHFATAFRRLVGLSPSQFRLRQRTHSGINSAICSAS